MIDEKREQVAKQCEAVAHLAGVLASVDKVNAQMVRGKSWDTLLDMIGYRTAFLMEIIGNALNDIDAVDDEEERFGSVFDAAHKMFPQAVSDADR